MGASILGFETLLEKGEGRTKLFLVARKLGRDFLISITGGREHLGAIGIGVYANGKATSSVMTMPGHKEDMIAKQGAEKIAKQLKTNCVLIAGIHIDNITKEEIEIAVKNAEELIDEFIALAKKEELV